MMFRKRNFLRYLSVFVLLALCAYGCCDCEGIDTEEVRGTFIFGDTAGLTYIIGNNVRQTEVEGKYFYKLDEDIQFKVGDIVIGDVIKGRDNLTPLELLPDAAGPEEDSVANLARFLLSLDDDADPSNGITISQETRANAVGISIDFKMSTSDFEKYYASTIQKLLDTSGGAMVPLESAQTYLKLVLADRVTLTRDTADSHLNNWYIKGEDDVPYWSVFEAMGYAVAQDRLWQMEVYRRTARGRLSELIGPGSNNEYKNSDILMRTIEPSEAKLTEYFKAMNTQARSAVLGYTAGINRRIAEVREDTSYYPYEFKKIEDSINAAKDDNSKLVEGFLLEDWTKEDLLACISMMQKFFDAEALDYDKGFCIAQLENHALREELAVNYQESFQKMFDDLRWSSINDKGVPTFIPDNSIVGSASNRTEYVSLYGNDPGVYGFKPAAGTISFLNITNFMDITRSSFEAMAQKWKSINASMKMEGYSWVIDGTKSQTGNPILFAGVQTGFGTPPAVVEGTIQAAGMDVSGMTVPCFPGILIGRTPHHAWSIQTGHLASTDFYYETKKRDITLIRSEEIKTRRTEGSPNDADQYDTESIDIFKKGDKVVMQPLPYSPGSTSVEKFNFDQYDPENNIPIIMWKYANDGYEFDTVQAFLDIANAKSLEDFETAVENVGTSLHFCYADGELNADQQTGHIAYMMSGKVPNRPAGEWRLPQNYDLDPLTDAIDWGVTEATPPRDDKEHFYGGWDDKSAVSEESAFNNYAYYFGRFHRGKMIQDYFKEHTTRFWFEDMEGLEARFANTDSVGGGGNPWQAGVYMAQVGNELSFVPLYKIFQNANTQGAPWDWIANSYNPLVKGSVDGNGMIDKNALISSTDLDPGWVLSDAWIKEVLRLTFEDELGPVRYSKEDKALLLNVFIRLCEEIEESADGNLVQSYSWFNGNNSQGTTDREKRNSLIRMAYNNAVVNLSNTYGSFDNFGAGQRGFIEFNHQDFPVTVAPYMRRSTFAQCVEIGRNGIAKAETLFPVSESGFVRGNRTDDQLTFEWDSTDTETLANKYRIDSYNTWHYLPAPELK